MKSVIFLLLLTLHASRFTLHAIEALPFYQFNFSEGVSIPSKGDFFAAHELDTKMGTLISATDKLKLFGLYNLTYEGPGLIRSEGRLFTERAIRHSVLFEPSYEFPYIGALKTRGFGIFERRRSGTNELWGKGLYDYNAYGGLVGIERKFGGFSFFPSVRYTTMNFPNYTDLLREFQSGGLTAEIAGGLIDQNVYAGGLLISHRNLTFDVNYNQQNFLKEKVLLSNGTYGSDQQKDKTYTSSLAMDVTLWRFTAQPKATLTMKRSNQNFLRYAFFGDTNPTFVAKNYNYNELNAGGTFLIRLVGKRYMYTGLDANWRQYSDRPPRDSKGNYLAGEKQKSFWAAYSYGFRWYSTDYTSWTLAYSLIFANSNMKFESFIPYNYTGQMVGLYFTVRP